MNKLFNKTKWSDFTFTNSEEDPIILDDHNDDHEPQASNDDENIPINLDEFKSHYVETNIETTPRSISDCKGSPNWVQWQNAIKSELNSLISKHVFEGPMELPADKQCIGNRWVFTVKRMEDGSIAKYKARLVAQGFSQRPGFDYDETYSPVIDMISYRYILAFATQLNMDIHSMDVVTAYLHGEIDKEIYMRVPEGIFVDPHLKNPCVKVVKALYGLKQSGRQWYLKFAQELVDEGYKYSKVNPCIFFKTTTQGRVICCIYVDDTTIMGNKLAIQTAKQKLSSVFEMKDLGRLKSCIGIQVFHTTHGTFIHQESYTTKILKEYRMDNATSRSNPLEVRGSLDLYGPKLDDEPLLHPSFPYAQAVGAISYLANSTRPDISYHVNILARHTHAPTKRHWNGVLQIFRYLKGTRDYGLYYDRGSLEILGYADAGYLSDWSTGKSQSGIVFTIGGTAFSWKSSKQTITATSTSNAEMVALFDATKEAVWLSNFLTDLYQGLDIPHQLLPITIFEDNLACLRQIMAGYIKSDMTKHLSPKFYFTTDTVNMGRIKVVQIPTIDNLADIFTKSLPGPRHQELRRKLGMMSLSEVKGIRPDGCVDEGEC